MPQTINSSVHLEGRSVVEGDITLQDKTTKEYSDKIKVTGKLIVVLAHLSRRLIGELIVYPCSGVRPSSFTISKIFFSETSHITHTPSTGRGKE